MDKLANRLREDAERIDIGVSDELDARIRASLRGVTPRDDETAGVLNKRPAMFWWASSVTGMAAAAVVIAIINIRTAEPPEISPASVLITVPLADLKAETAMMTRPLEEELDRLQSDIRKAEQRVREDIGL